MTFSGNFMPKRFGAGKPKPQPKKTAHLAKAHLLKLQQEKK